MSGLAKKFSGAQTIGG